MNFELEETKILNIIAKGEEKGEFENTLICEVENNPKPFLLKLHYVCYYPEIEIRNHFLDFG